MNAGSGCYEIADPSWSEVCIDLFAAPLQGRLNAVCGTVEALPFADETFDCVTCVGEVLAYCDPSKAFSEFSRVLTRGGVLIFDFGSTTSARHLLRPQFGRAADVITDIYNDRPERVWIYSPKYIVELLRSRDFTVERQFGAHTWSALARRFGASPNIATYFEKTLRSFRIMKWADLVTVVAVRG